MYEPSLQQPKAKRYSKAKKPVLQQPLPVPIASLTEIKANNSIWRWYEGSLNRENMTVTVLGNEEAVNLSQMGFFGMTNMELGARDKYHTIVCEDFDPMPAVKGHGDPEEIQLDSPPHRPKNFEPEEIQFVRLDTCEAFFLSYALGCLLVKDGDKELTIDDMYERFSEDKEFPYRYVVYHHFRAKGWVVRNGVKFGSDLLLYKHGPPFYHASYSVKVVINEQNPSWRDLTGLNRVTEAAAKELLLVRVDNVRQSEHLSDPGALKHLKVTEVLIRRWVPTQEREEEL